MWGDFFLPFQIGGIFPGGLLPRGISSWIRCDIEMVNTTMPRGWNTFFNAKYRKVAILLSFSSILYHYEILNSCNLIEIPHNLAVKEMLGY